MIYNFKIIHIGQMIKERVIESGIESSRICNFLKCTEEEIKVMYTIESIDTEILLRWSKLLEYDFFRLYSQHLIFYSPPASIQYNKKTELPTFRKNIYTREVIEFVVEMVETGEKSKNQIINEYKIPKTTFYKWLKKHKK